MNDTPEGQRPGEEQTPADEQIPAHEQTPAQGQTGWAGTSGQPAAASPWRRPASESAQTPPATPPPPRATHQAPGPESDTTVFAAPSAAPAASTGSKGKGRGGMLIASVAIAAILGGGAGAAVATWLDDDSGARSSQGDNGPGESSLAPEEETDSENSGQDDEQPAASLENVESVADQVLPSVVSITVGTQFGGSGTGSGVVISSDGEILTNNHVVEAAGERGNLHVTFADGSTAEAEVVGTDPVTDLAVIRAQEVSDLTPADLGSSGDLSVGQQVVAIGSPLGLDGTVTTGIVSALQRPIVVGEQQNSATYIDAIQTDAPINQGNSGGPLVNMAGEVIGVNSAILTSGTNTGSIGLGFSIPIDQARPIAEELIETGTATHARIGIEVGTPQDGTAGALVGGITPGSSADEAGLQEGDIITKIDNRIINDHVTLIAAARSYRPGDEVTLTYQRDGEEQTTTLTLGSDATTT